MLLFSCSKREVGEEVNNEVETAAGLCLRSLNYDFPKILSKEDIKKHSSIDETSFEQDVYNSSGRYGYITYQWKSDRPDGVIDINGTLVPVPDKNMVQFKFLSFYEKSDLDLYNHETILSLFDIEYKKLSEEEVAAMKKNLESHYANNPSELKNALDLLEQRLQFNYTPLENLGDRAYWKWDEKEGLSLSVLTGTATFTLNTKVSVDKETNLSVATNIAREIMGKCD